MQLHSRLFKSKLKKVRKNSSLKKFLIFQEMELSCPNIKKFYTFWDTETLKRFLIFRKMKLSSSNIKKILRFSHKKAFLIFQETNPPPPSKPKKKKSLYFNKQNLNSGNGNPKKLLILQERASRLKKLKKSLNVSYISENRTFYFLVLGLKNFLYFRRNFQSLKN